MKYVLSELACKKDGISLSELLFTMLLCEDVDLDTLIEEMLEEGKIVKNSGGKYLDYSVTNNWHDRCTKILLNADSSIPKEDRLDVLVDKLRSIYPEGKKQGTSNYWRGNKKEIKLKLQKFFKLYGSTYTDAQIIKATEKYISTFNGNYSYMRVLNYFICKNVRKENSDGTASIEEVSDLATYIENEGQEEGLNGDWTATLR